MAKRSYRHRFMRFATALMMGGAAFQLSGCDPTVRDTVLTGLESTATTLGTTLISAFFLSLNDNATTDTGLTTT